MGRRRQRRGAHAPVLACVLMTAMAFQAPVPAPAWRAALRVPSSQRPPNQQAPRSGRMRRAAAGAATMMAGAQSGDVLVVGGGLAGLSAALELAQRGAKVVVVNRDGRESASLAAGGMLAPQAERLAAGPYLDLCLQSRGMYPGWVAMLEEASGGLLTGFKASGGFLAPAFPGDAVDQWTPPPEAGRAYRLDGTQMRGMEPALSEAVSRGWWFPDDMQVDARRIHASLREACVRAGVSLLEGLEWEVEALVFSSSGGGCRPRVAAARLPGGRELAFGRVIVANGAWMNRLLPVPMAPIKGQMLSLRPVGRGQPSPLSRVVFAESCYLIPKADGRLIVGATVEPGKWGLEVTAGGVHELTSRALRVCPALGELEVEEAWAGLRPTTPDTLPVIGRTPWENLFVAGGYWRNGVLLAPRTGQLVADAVEGKPMPNLLDHFRWSRFLSDASAEEAAGGSVTAAFQGRAVTPATTAAEQLRPSQPVAAAPTSVPTSSSSSSVPPAGVHTDDPYADYAQMRRQGGLGVTDPDAVLREARRENREGLVGYGLGEDPVGREVASKFNVPSAEGMDPEWGRYEAAAMQGLQDLAVFDISYLTDTSHFGAHEPGEGHEEEPLRHHLHVPSSSFSASAPVVVTPGPGPDDETIEEMMARLGYEYREPRAAKVQERELIRRGLAQPAPPSAAAGKGAQQAAKPMDVYEEIYSEEVRPKTGWEVLRQREREQQERGTSGVHADDPYADYAQMRGSDAGAEARAAAELREARRKNREGLVGYGLGEDPVGREVASKFNVPSAEGMDPEWDRYEAAAMQGLQDLGLLGGVAVRSGSGSGFRGPGQTVVEQSDASGLTIDELMRGFGYQYEDSRTAKAQRLGERQQQQQQPQQQPQSSPERQPQRPPQPAPVPASLQPFRPAPAPATITTDLPLPPRSNTGAPPPWAPKIEALYEAVKANQAAVAKRAGASPPGAVVVPFHNRPEDCPRDAQGRPRALSREEMVEKLEVMRVNPDGTFTRVQLGQGLPPPWTPGQQQEATADAAAALGLGLGQHQQDGVGR